MNPYFTKPLFKLDDIVLYFPYGKSQRASMKPVSYAGKIILVHKKHVTVQLNSPFKSVRNFSLKTGVLQGSSKENKSSRPFIRKATSEEVSRAAKQEAFDMLRVYFQDYSNCDKIADYMVCRIQNMIGKQNELISMYESERVSMSEE